MDNNTKEYYEIMSKQKCCRCDDDGRTPYTTGLVIAYNDSDGNFVRGWCEECWENVIEEQKNEEEE